MTHHKDGWLRFPIRNGAATRWMLEPEVAARYRDRFVQGRAVQDRLDDVEIECLLGYEERDVLAAVQNGFTADVEPARPILAVTVVPEIAGRLVINRAALMEFQQDSESVLLERDIRFRRTQVAPGRLVGMIGDPAIAVYVELHQDGSGTFLVSLLPDSKIDGVVELSVQDATFYVLSALRVLGRHARDRAGATGVASVRLSILGGVSEAGGVETSYPPRGTPYEIKLTSEGNYGYYANLRASSRATGETFAHVDDLAVDGPGLISAAAMVANEACHAFGLPEVPLLDVDGTININHWGQSLLPTISKWSSKTK
jgi:hypothetical protein